MNQKEKEYEKVKGGNKFVSRDELAKYAQNLRVKKNTFEQLKSQLKDIRNELTVVTRTEQILKAKADEEMRVMMAIEREHGIEGFGEYKEALEQVSSIKQNIDLKKGTTLEEISKVVAEINYRITESRAKISPIQLADSQLKRVTTEQSCRNGEKKFSAEFASLQENYNWKLQQQTKLTAELRNHQKSLKENHENSSKQVKMFSDLRKLLNLKQKVAEEENGDSRNNLRGKDLGGDIGVGGVNRLVLGD